MRRVQECGLAGWGMITMLMTMLGFGVTGQLEGRTRLVAGRLGRLVAVSPSERAGQCRVADRQQIPDNPENLMLRYFFYKEIISMKSYRPSGLSGFY